MTPRTRSLVVVSAIVALGLSACGAGGAVGQRPAATVGGVSITDAEVAKEASLFTFLAALNRTTCGTKTSDAESQTSACNRFALSNLIQEHVAESYASSHHLTVTEQQITSIIGNLDGQIGKDTVDKDLKQNGLDRTDLHDLARSVLLFQRVQGQVTSDQLGDAQLRKLYRQQILSFTTIDVDHILVKTKAEAEKVYREVTAPGATKADFEALARKVSIDPNAKQNGGALGSSAASQYLPEFAAAAAALRPGQISRPVQTQLGWHVILLNAKQVTPFSQARSQLLQSQGTTAFNAWMRDQVDAEGVVVNPGFGRFDPATLSVVPIHSTDPSDTASPASPSGGTSPTPSP